MRTCTHCGEPVNDSSAFCTHCGTRMTYTPPSYPTPAPGYTPPYPPANSKMPISVGGWIGRSLIPMIPLVGSIIYLIMLFIWSGDYQKEDTFRNWAKAQLIVMAIVIVLTIVFYASIISIFSDLIGLLL